MGSRDLFTRPRPEHSHMVEEDGPVRRWSPRRVVVGADQLADRGAHKPAPVRLGVPPEELALPSPAAEPSAQEEDVPLSLPEPPPPGPGDDLRLPSPDTWAESGRLPVWFWVVAVVMVVLCTLVIVQDSTRVVSVDDLEDFEEP